MKVTARDFGTTKDGRKATLYTMENSNGMKVSVTDYGACVVNIIVPDKNGKLDDVALGFDDVRGYDENYTYFGAFVGRNGNRIGGAKFSINGKEYKLEDNDNGNNLHSGLKGFNNMWYDVEVGEEEDGIISVDMSRRSLDGEQGFPGNLDITVSYSLTEDNEFAIDYYGICDKDTVINLTNHSFFNLSGQASGSILDHEIFIDADYFTPTDDKLIPTGELRKVSGTPMDFKKSRRIGDRIDDDYEPLKQAGGYDHNYVLNNSGEDVELVATLSDPKSGRKMDVYTDLPGMQFYAGNFITGTIAGKGGHVYKKRDGLCLETQMFPDACNEKEYFKTSVVKAFKEYETVTVYKFYTE
ncbi:MAG: galactose mutarotase [Lachnospiraceae bacterium]|nr:galactose mutarotase [Lachnospiraceae bacterium]